MQDSKNTETKTHSSNTEAETKVDIKAETKVDTKTETKAETKVDTKAESISEKENKTSKPGRWVEIFAFLILFAVILEIMAYLTSPIRSNQPAMAVARDRNVIAALANKPDDMDVIVAGDSEAMVMVSTNILMDEAGISSFNCNQLGARVSETYFCMNKLLKKQHPQVETNIITQDTTFNTEVHLTYNAMMQEAFPYIKYHSNWRRRYGFEDLPGYSEYRGFEEIYVVDPYYGDEYMFETEDRYNVNPIAMYYLDKIRELCDDKGITLILVTSPSVVNMNYSKHNTLQDYADKYNLKYIDFNLMTEELGLDWTNDTGDAGDHINAYGTEKTTRYLMEYLNENFDLPDHRED